MKNLSQQNKSTVDHTNLLFKMVLGIILVSSCFSCEIKPQLITNHLPNTVRVNNIGVYEDSLGTLTIEQASLEPNKFKPFSGLQINFGSKITTGWVKISIHNISSNSQEIIVNTDQLMLESYSLFYKYNNKWVRHFSRWGLPEMSKVINSASHSFAIPIEPNQAKDIFIRISNKYQVLRLPLDIFSKEQFYIHNSSNNFKNGLVSMALFIAICYSVFVLLYKPKDIVVISWYLLYAFTFFTFYIIRITTAAFITWPLPILLNQLALLPLYLSIYAYYRFSYSFLNLDTPRSKYQISRILDFLFLSAIVSVFFQIRTPRFPFWYFQVVFFVATLCTLFYFILKNLKNNYLARVYFILASPLIISSFLEGLTNLFGVLQIPIRFFEYLKISICIETLCILLSLIYREKYLQKLYEDEKESIENRIFQSQFTIRETEQKRIAKDIHDDLGGTLSAIKGKVANESTDPDTLILVEKAIEDLRNISRNLLPPELAKNGLIKAIQQNVERLQSESLKLTFITFGKEIRMTSDRELNTYRILLELLNNVVKHSMASKATVQVIFFDKYLQIMIEDNGNGIKTVEKNWGIGLKNVSSRVEFLSAKLLRDTNQNGTSFIIELPFE